MPTYLCAIDETSTQNPRTWSAIGGFVAPTNDWTDFFEPAWRDRVLAGPPRLDHFHATDLGNLKPWDASARVSEGVKIVSSLGSIRLLTSELREHDYEQGVRGKLRRGKYNKPLANVRDPDILGFIAIAALAAESAATADLRDAVKVDFLIEANGKVTRKIQDAFDSLPDTLARIGRQHVLPHVGKLDLGGKNDIPLQAADLLLWHLQRYHSRHDYQSVRTLQRLAKNNGIRHKWELSALDKLGNGFLALERGASSQTEGSGSV
jgi:hypothetical protein